MPAGYQADLSFLAEARKLRGEGLSFSEISKIVGVDRRIIGKHLAKDMKKRELPNSKAMQAMRDKGMFVREIAAHFSVSPTTVKAHTTAPKGVKSHPLYATRKEREAIRKRKESGATIKEIAAEFNRSTDMVRRTCISEDVAEGHDSRIKINDSHKHKIKMMRDSGKTLTDIANHLNISQATIKSYLSRARKQEAINEGTYHPAIKPMKNDPVRDSFIAGAVNIAIGNSKAKLQIPEHVMRMKLSLMMARGFSESDALAQAMNFYSRGKVTAADDDYQPRRPIIRRRA